MKRRLLLLCLKNAIFVLPGYLSKLLNALIAPLIDDKKIRKDKRYCLPILSKNH